MSEASSASSSTMAIRFGILAIGYQLENYEVL